MATMSATATKVESLIDLDRYPIMQPASEAFAALAARCRAQLDATGCCILPGFLTDDVITRCVEEAVAIAPRACRSEQPVLRRTAVAGRVSSVSGR
jgi:hypothetical protein